MTLWEYALLEMGPGYPSRRTPGTTHWSATWYGPDGAPSPAEQPDAAVGQGAVLAAMLNRAGADGWELVNTSELTRIEDGNRHSWVSSSSHIFKRPAHVRTGNAPVADDATLPPAD